MGSLRHSTNSPPDLRGLLEEKWERREIWGSAHRWQEFLDERMALATPNLEILTDLLGEHLRLDGRKSLDVGCGEGGLARTLTDRGSEAVGVELDHRNLIIAQAARSYNGLAPATLVRGTGVHLPFRDASFDLATAVETIEHVDQPESLVAEIFRVVRPGGHVLVTSPNVLQPYEPHARMLGVHWLPTSLRHGLGRVLGAGSDLSKRMRLVDDLRYFSPVSFTALLRGYSASIVDLREAWLRRLLHRHGTRRSTSDDLSARFVDLLARLRPQNWPHPLLRLLLQLMPLKVLCRKGGDET